ncbi:O-antigen translocase [Pseudomonas cavernae]|uniref:O-antigen translocase n=1 Tax=Pseudomonas cavernae TaxID=2320867 RepID=UPI001EE563B2|nr:O-antigen translocase [Pseudomonas cavernae]
MIKLVAMYLGVEGLGKLGNFMNAVALLYLLAGGGVINGVVKYVAEYNNRPRALLSFVSTAATYSFIVSVLIFLLVATFSARISSYVFGSSEYFPAIIFLACAQLGFAFSNMVIGVANGLRDTKTFAKIQILGNSIAFPFSWYLIAEYKLLGAILAIVFSYLLYVFPAFYLFVKSKFWGRIFFTGFKDKGFLKLFSYSLMVCAGAISFPLVEMLVREMIIRSYGYQAAGLWQASIRLSSAYLGFFTIFLAYYFVPLISAENNKNEIGRMVLKFLIFVSVIFLAGATVFYIRREFFIGLLLSHEFEPLGDLIKYQLLGDFFKISAYVIGFVGVAKAALKLYLAAELFQGGAFLLTTWLSVQQGFGLEGVLVSYVITNFIYFILACAGIVIYVKR